jgi:hypothetical protein
MSVLKNITSKTYKRAAIILALFGIIGSIQAQTPIKKEVEVVKPYQPVISNAYKINVLPKITDSINIKPTFEYGITSKKVETGFEVSPIKAASMISTSLPRLYKTYFKLGLGNYSTTYGELFINTLRSKKGTAGIYFNHFSSTGNVKLDNGRKVYGGYSDNNASVYGKRFLKKAELTGELNFDSKTVHHYGFRTDLKDTLLTNSSIRQNFIHLNVKGGVQSTHTDSSMLAYLGLVNYHYTQDKFDHNEHQVSLNAAFSKQFRNNYVGINTNLDIYKRSTNLDSFKNALLMVNPYILLASDDYRLNLGFKAYMATENDGSYLKLYPNVDFQFNVVKEVIVPFIGITGNVKSHSYHDIAWENPYILPNLIVRNTDSKLDIYGGVKGNLGTKSGYVLKFAMNSASNYYFYANDSSRLWNKFTVVYDEGDLFKVSGEVSYDPSDKIGFHLASNYYDYSLLHEKYAWQRQSFDLTFTTRYNLRNKIIASLETYYIGKRYAKPYTLLSDPIELKGFVDINLLLEYRYTKILSGFIQVRNLTASQYQVWNQYPSQRFNILFGFTYAL